MDKIATFAGGCFWCLEPAFDGVKGVKKTVVGYTGGHAENPTYEQVCSGTTGHAEAIQVVYDPEIVSYEQLLNVFWSKIDPTLQDRQFTDAGSQYRSVIFYHDEEQFQKAEESKKILEKSGLLNGSIMTGIEPAKAFFPAEEYHQDYYRKKPLQYKAYYYGSGRAAFCPVSIEALRATKILGNNQK
ncbi:MAG: peptide-methionine (S)-S-oxide reductase MsrA [Candidatus Omnitrophota bacterium]